MLGCIYQKHLVSGTWHPFIAPLWHFLDVVKNIDVQTQICMHTDFCVLKPCVSEMHPKYCGQGSRTLLTVREGYSAVMLYPIWGLLCSHNGFFPLPNSHIHHTQKNWLGLTCSEAEEWPQCHLSVTTVAFPWGLTRRSAGAGNRSLGHVPEFQWMNLNQIHSQGRNWNAKWISRFVRF